MDALKQKRSILRSAFTRSANNLEALLAATQLKASDIEINFEQISERFKQLKECDTKLLELLQKENCTSDEYEKEYTTCESYEDKFIALKIKVKNVLAGNAKHGTDLPHYTETAFKCKLPEIQLPTFDGNPREWLNFWTQFQKIHEEASIDERDKYQYLIQSTVPGSAPREIVESFPATAENYKKAVEYLKERFGKESVLVQVYIRDLLQLVIAKNKCELSTLYDKLQTRLRSLDSLGLTKDKYADILFPLIESTLPVDIVKMWDRQRHLVQDTQGKSDLDLLMDFVKNEVDSEFRVKISREIFNTGKITNKKSVSQYSESKPVVSTACELLTANDNNKSTENIRKFKKFDVCIFCDKSHASESCNEVSNMNLDCKKDILKKKKACFVCLKRFHRANQCKSGHKCHICKKRHFVILCPDLPSNKLDKLSNGENDETKTSTLNSHVQLSDVYLQTLIVRLCNGKKEMFIRAIYDTGSMKSYISSDVAQSMNYEPISEVNLKQSLFGAIETDEVSYKNYVIELSNVDNSYKCKFEVLGQNRICSEIKQIPSGPSLKEFKMHGIKLTDLENSTLKVDKEIKLLIGADVAGKLFTGKIIPLKSNLTAVHTRLGWTVLGKLFGSEPSVESKHSLIISSLLTQTQCISDLWSLDVLGITGSAHRQTAKELEEETTKYFNETLCVTAEGRYEVALPWVVDNSSLPENKKLAEKSLLSTKRKLMTSGKLEAYGEVFDNWLNLGIIEKIPQGETGRVHYLPHRPVIKEGSTTNIRPVFNASSHALGFPSLNDCLSSGPNLIEIIPTILNRFRRNYVGVTSDIEKAFLQISIREKDRDYLRFLWLRKDDLEQVEEYRHRRVVFGLTCSPYLLAATLQYHLNRVQENLSCTSEILKTAFYVDNCVTSLDSGLEMRKFILESQIIMSSGNFNLRGWKSNLHSVVPNGDISTDENVSVLGLVWHTDTDTLSCKVEQTVTLEKPITKRLVLAIAHQIFDPIGFTTPVMLIPKLILQETWNLKLKRDDTLPDDVVRKFKSWYRQLYLIANIRVPRWFSISPTTESLSVHVFCDASQKAYATCIFLRVKQGDKIVVTLVHARRRVAPVKTVTIPRLELLACLIGARLLSSVLNDLKLYDFNIYCWTDSTTALCWIQRDQNWGTFVQNRVREIRSLTSPTVWRHVPGALNAADLVSRGCSGEQLLQGKWWEGPSWLSENEESWPKSEADPDEDLVSSEKRKTIITTLTKNGENVDWYYKYFSSVRKIVHMLAWIFRFYNKLRKIASDSSKTLSVSELEKAEISLMLLIQKESFKDVNDDKLKKLRPIIDCNGLIRAKTNISNRDDTNDFKFPIILPSDHTVVKLLIMNAHNDLLHAGTSMLMSHLREKYWIIKARKTIRNCIRKCVKCQRFKTKKCEVSPGILPKDRVCDAATFEIVGVDLAGPLYLRNCPKAYIVLYTCAVYRAIHLELITSLTTEVFLQSLRRFIARRGRPTTIYSDNGTNFKGAERLLHALDW
ncbi:hypothetical protein AVEN_84131-1, partial [Araneus ventricosus]